MNKLTTLTPVHIGTSQVENLSQVVDYVYKDGLVHTIDFEKLQKAIKKRSRPNFNLEEKFLEDLRERRIRKLDEFLEQNNISITEIEDYRLKTTGSISGEIQKMIHSEGRPYIPGSSIKGMLRTALAYWYLKNDKDILIESVEHIIENRVRPKKAFQSLNGRIFLDPNRDPLKNIIVSDSEFIPKEKILISPTKRMSIKSVGRDVSIPIPVEVISTETEVSFSIKIQSLKVFNPKFSFLEDTKAAFPKLCQILNEFSKASLKREIQELTSPNFSSIKSKYERFLKEIEDSKINGCIGRLGFGKTFWDETVILILKDDRFLLQKYENYMNRNFWRRKFKGEWILRKRSLFKNEPLPFTRLFIYKDNQPKGVLGWVKLYF